MEKCDLPFSFWSPVSPRKPVQYQCNSTTSARVIDRTLDNAKTPFPLENPPSYTCEDSKKNVEHVTNKVPTDFNKKEPCCQHAQEGIHKVGSKVSQSGSLKGVIHKIQHKIIPVKSLVQDSAPERVLVSTKFGKTCHHCKKYEVDKAKPIEKLIAETRINAKLCIECECHAKAKEASYLKPIRKVKERNNKLSTPPPDNCCTEDCVGKRVYSKPLPFNKKKKSSVVHLKDWPWYWAKYYPIAASRVAKRIIQAKIDAKKAKANPPPEAEFEVRFLPSKRCPLGEVSR